MYRIELSPGRGAKARILPLCNAMGTDPDAGAEMSLRDRRLLYLACLGGHSGNGQPAGANFG
jgi:hypothetical protein